MDLSLVPIDDLLKEISSRHNHLVVVGVKIIDKDNTIYMRRWWGNNHVCVGLIVDASIDIIADHKNREIPLQPGDA